MDAQIRLSRYRHPTANAVGQYMINLRFPRLKHFHHLAISMAFGCTNLRTYNSHRETSLLSNRVCGNNFMLAVYNSCYPGESVPSVMKLLNKSRNIVIHYQFLSFFGFLCLQVISSTSKA